MDSRAARLARGWIVGTFATLVAAASHTLAGGGIPSPLALGTGLVFAGLLGTLAMGRRPSLPRLAVTAGGAQLAFHAMFALLSTSSAMPAGAGHLHRPVALDVIATSHTTDPAMWLGHAVAAVATIAFLARAERALWGLLREVLGRATAPITLSRLPVRPARIRSTGFDRTPHSRDLAAVLTRRGPPVLRFG